MVARLRYAPRVEQNTAVVAISIRIFSYSHPRARPRQISWMCQKNTTSASDKYMSKHVKACHTFLFAKTLIFFRQVLQYRY